ncbi:MAG: hypothetical protein LBT36_03620, partial [Oscillospiraceae bacterium]|nr:hypothetical protein [Oscillospiraceae bacterium]
MENDQEKNLEQENQDNQDNITQPEEPEESDAETTEVTEVTEVTEATEVTEVTEVTEESDAAENPEPDTLAEDEFFAKNFPDEDFSSEHAAPAESAAAPEEPQKSSPEALRKKRRKRLQLNLILVVCAAVLVFAGYKIAYKLLDYKRGTDTYTDLANTYLEMPSNAPPTATRTPDAPPDPSAEPDASPTQRIVDEPAPDAWPKVNFAGL